MKWWIIEIKCCTRTHSPEEGECLNQWVLGLLESLARGCPSAGLDEEGLVPLSWLQPKRPAKLAWPVWRQQACFFCLFFFFFLIFLSNYLLLFYYFFSFNTFYLSFFLSSSTPSFSPSISLLPSTFFFFFNLHKWHNKTWNCEKTKDGPKEGVSNSWDNEINFTLLLHRTGKLLHICIIIFFHYSYITHFISIFVFLFFLFSLLPLSG